MAAREVVGIASAVLNVGIMNMRLRLLATSLLALLWSASAYAADVAGTWSLQVNTQAGVGTPTLVLVQDGEALTGTYTGRFGESPITGTIHDNDIVFSFTVSGPMGSAKVTYTGVVADDAVSGSMTMGERAGGTFTGKKQ